MELFFIIISIVFIICVGIAIYKETHSRPGKQAPKTSCPPKRILGFKFTRLSLKSIIRWEQIRGKSFSLMECSDKDDVEALLYTMYICEAMSGYSFEVFRQVLANEKFTENMTSEMNQIVAIVTQFQKKREISNVGSVESNPETIGNIISMLVMSGLDAHYVLNEMDLCDLPLYIEAYQRKRKEEMESARMWTYFTILPHIDGKKMKNGAKDLISFPWEKEEKIVETQITESEVDRFEAFMKIGKDFLKQ